MDYSGPSKTAHLGVVLDAFYPGDELLLSYSTNAPKAGVILTLTVTTLSVNTVITNGTNTTHTLSATMGSLLPIVVEAGITDATALLSPRNVTFAVTCSPALVPTTLVVGSTNNPAVYGQPTPITATLTAPAGTPNGNVVFTVDGVAQPAVPLVSGVATLNAAGLGAGSHTVSASYAGNGTFSASNGTLTNGQTVTAASTTTALGTSSATSTFGNNLTFTAAVTANAPGGGVPVGTVIFSVDGVDQSPAVLSNGTATLVTSALAAGSHAIAARYTGSTNHAASTAALSGGQVVTKAASSTTITQSAATTTFGQLVTFHAAVTAVAGTPTGTVTFSIDGVAQAPVAVVAGGAELTLASLAVGDHTVSAVYSGSANIAASNGSLSSGHGVTLIPTTVTASSAATVTFGTDPSISVTVSSGGGTPTGSVVLVLDGIAGAPVAIANGTATITLTGLSAGTHPIAVNYLGSATHAASSGTLAGGQAVNQASTATAIAPASATFGEGADVTATVTSPGGTPTGIVIFTVDGVAYSPVQLTGGQARLHVTGLSAGSHAVSAEYVASTNHASSTGSASITINKAVPTVVLSSTINPSVAGQNLQLAAVVNSVAGVPTGSVTFTVGGITQAPVSLVAGVATISVQSPGAGSAVVTAEYSGDGSFESASGTLVGGQTVGQASTDVALSTQTDVVPVGVGAMVTATISAIAPGSGTPTGNVTFHIDGVPQASTALINGGATLNVPALAVGPHTITADYAGDTQFSASTGTLAAGITVDAGTTTMSVTATPQPAVYGQPVSLTATLLSSPLTPVGTVTFEVDGVLRAPVALVNGVASEQLTGLEPGTYTVVAHYSGSVDHLPLDQALSGGIVVGQASTPLVVTATSMAPDFGDALTVTATLAASDAGGDVVFLIDGIAQAPVAVLGGIASLNLTNLDIGAHTVAAQFLGDTHYLATSAALPALTIHARPTSAQVVAVPASPEFGQSVTFEATLDAGAVTPVGDVVFTVDGVAVTPAVALLGGVARVTIPSLAVGPHSVHASFAAQGNFAAASATLTGGIDVAVGATTTVLAGPTSAAVVGTPTQFTATVSAAHTTPNGNVVFTVDGVGLAPVALVNGEAILTHTFATAGAHTVAATFLPTASFATSSDSLSSGVAVSPAAASTTLNIVGSSQFGEPVVAIVSVASGAGVPTGQVDVLVDGVTAGTAMLVAGTANISVSNLAPGAHTITASYSGNADFAGSVSPSATLNVSAAPTSTSISASRATLTLGDNVTFAVQVSADYATPDGNITIDVEGTAYPATLINGSAAVTVSNLSAGLYRVSAEYDGNANFAASDATLSSGIVVVSLPTSMEVTPHLPRALVGQPYVGALTARGGLGPYSFAVTGGSLPAGLSLDPATGSVSGTLVEDGQHAVQFTVSGGLGTSATVSVTMQVLTPATISMPASLPQSTAAVAYSASVAASGGTAPYTYALSAGALPAGLTLNASTGRVTGTPTVVGSNAFTLLSTDANGFTGQAAYQLDVVAPAITISGTFPRAAVGAPFSGIL